MKKKLFFGSVAVFALVFAYLFGKNIQIGPDPALAGLETEINAVAGEVSGDKNEIFPDDLIYGAKEKPAVTLIEYASFTCPHCAHLHQTVMRTLKKDYATSDNVAIIYRDFPLDGAALKAAQLSLCEKSKQGGFVDLLYAKQQEWTRIKTKEELYEKLYKIAKIGGLSQEKAKDCMDSVPLRDKILEKQRHGDKMFAITATPTLILNGEKIPSNIQYDVLKKKIETMIKARTASPEANK